MEGTHVIVREGRYECFRLAGFTGAIVAVVAVIYVSQAIRIVRQFEKGLIETFGQYSQTVSAGLVLIFPPIQSLRKVDMREQVMEVPPQEVITKDNASVQVDAVFYFQVADPVKVVYNVAPILRWPRSSSRRPISATSSATWNSIKR